MLLVKKIESEIIKRISDLISEKPSVRPMDTLAYAYYLSMEHAQFSEEIKNKLITKIVSINDAWCDMMEASLEKDGPNCTSEWEAMSIPFVSQLAGKFLDADKLKRWQKWSIAYCDAQAKRPFYYTAYNHEIMRCATMYLNGEVFNRPDLVERAIYFAKRILEFVTPHGFWEEGTHHGTSLAYNRIMLHGLAWMSRLTKDRELIKATQKLADFTTTYCFSDGMFSGSLDGRMAPLSWYKLIMFIGLEFTNQGQAAFSRHEKEFFNKLDKPEANIALSNFFVISGLVYCKRFNVEDVQEGVLPLDKNIKIEEHSGYHDTVTQRNGKWATILSGHTSNIPKEAPSLFRLERQSRIDIWHEDLGIMIGGSHNRLDNKTPYANFMVSTQFNQQDFHFGEITSSDKKANLSMYIARAAKTYFSEKTPHLKLFFAHASIDFSVHVLNENSLEVRYEVECNGAQKIAVQLPIVVWKGDRIYAGSQLLETSYEHKNQLLLSKEITVRTAKHKEFTVSSEQTIGTRYPHMPIITYDVNEKDFFNEEDYYIAMLSQQFENPANQIQGSFKINIH